MEKGRIPRAGNFVLSFVLLALSGSAQTSTLQVTSVVPGASVTAPTDGTGVAAKQVSLEVGQASEAEAVLAYAPRTAVARGRGNCERTAIRAGYGISCEPAATGRRGVPGPRVGHGLPEQLTPPTLQPSAFLTPPAQLLRNAPQATGYSPELKRPTVHEWNLTIQHQYRKFRAESRHGGQRRHAPYYPNRRGWKCSVTRPETRFLK